MKKYTELMGIEVPQPQVLEERAEEGADVTETLNKVKGVIKSAVGSGKHRQVAEGHHILKYEGDMDKRVKVNQHLEKTFGKRNIGGAHVENGYRITNRHNEEHGPHIEVKKIDDSHHKSYTVKSSGSRGVATKNTHSNRVLGRR